MTRLAMLSAVCALTMACAGTGRVSVRPGTDMALAAPDSSTAAPVAGAICIVASSSEAEKQACTAPRVDARGVQPTPATVRKPQMRVRTMTSIFRRR